MQPSKGIDAMQEYLKAFYAATFAVAAALPSPAAPADHIVITEVMVDEPGSDGNGGEYIEIFNPTAQAIDLTNYYLSDSPNYFRLPELGAAFDWGASDNLVRFPAGAVLGGGQVALVAGRGSKIGSDFFGNNLDAFFALPGAPLLFELESTDARAADMIVPHTGAPPTNTNWSRTNAGASGGEFIVLFSWDGTSNRVQDVDAVQWGFPGTGTNGWPVKGNGASGGVYPYADEAAFRDGGTQVSAGIFGVFFRTTLDEAEQAGGNGLTGQDESSEPLATTFSGTGSALANAFSVAGYDPGITSLTVPGQNAPPLVESYARNIEYPGTTDTIAIAATITDSDGTVTSASLLYRTGQSGVEGEPLSVPMTVDPTSASLWRAPMGPFAEGTFVEYWIAAGDDDGATASTSINPQVMLVEDNPATDGTELVITEILFNNPGGDAYEFVEFHNRGGRTLRLGGFGFRDLNPLSFRLPLDAVIPAGGYLVVSLDPARLQEVFGQPIEPSYDWGTFNLNNNGSETVSLIHVNALSFEGPNAPALVAVTYQASDQPEGERVARQVIVATTNRTLSLIDPGLDPALPSSWGLSLIEGGTPGRSNAIVSGATEWTLYQ